MLITLVFSVVPMKSRTFFSFSYPANKHVCRSWEGAWADREPSWGMEYSISETSCSVYEWGLARWQESFLSHLHEFKSSLGWESELFEELGLFHEFCEIHETHDFPGSATTSQGLAATWS